MENSKMVEQPAQGAELPELQSVKVRKALVADLQTARAIIHIASTSENVMKSVRSHLEISIKDVPEIQGLQKDASLASALVTMLLENDMILDQITDVVIGLQENLREKRKNSKSLV